MARVRKYWDFALTAVMVASVLLALGYLKATTNIVPNVGNPAFADADAGPELVEGRSVALQSPLEDQARSFARPQH